MLAHYLIKLFTFRHMRDIQLGWLESSPDTFSIKIATRRFTFPEYKTNYTIDFKRKFTLFSFFFQIINLSGWIISLVVINVCVFGTDVLDSKTTTTLEHGLWMGLSRVCWAIAISYIIFACHHNSGGPINWFLGHALWQPLSRLSYSMYLMQFLVLFFTMGTTKQPFDFSELNCFAYAMAIYTITAVVSIVTSLAFESPISYIEEFIFSFKMKN